jgi:hypothetical protein
MMMLSIAIAIANGFQQWLDLFWQYPNYQNIDHVMDSFLECHGPNFEGIRIS